jgi:Fe-Mn family superoxide dismutase
MRNIHWEWVGQRFRHVSAGGPVPEVHYGKGALAPESLQASLAGGAKPLLLDVRRRKAYEAGPDLIAGAEWREPENVAEWAGALPKDRDIVVYCVYGHNVSEDIAAALAAKGLKVQALAGGIAAWRAVGGPTQAKKG